jgi:hypothetical protein
MAASIMALIIIPTIALIIALIIILTMALIIASIIALIILILILVLLLLVLVIGLIVVYIISIHSSISHCRLIRSRGVVTMLVIWMYITIVSIASIGCK